MSAFRFGPYRVDVAAREIHRAGRALAVPVKVFDCIAYLVSNRHRAVGRDELIAAIWGRADVADNLLAQIVLRARRLFEDSSDEPRFIRTVPGFGYHWVHEAAEAPLPGSPAASAPAVAAMPAHRRALRRLGALAAGLALAVAIGLGLYGRGTDRTRPDPVAEIPAGADAAADRGSGRAGPALLLPAEVSGEPDYAWARLGIMDLIAQRLRAAGQPTVPSETVVALVPAEAAPVDADALAEASGSRWIFRTAVERRGGQWRVGVRTLRPQAPPIEVTGEAADLLAAADAAAGQLITALGLAGPTSIASTPADRLIQEVEAALLADQLDRARGLIETAPAPLRADPRVRYQHARIDLSQARLDAARATLDGLLAEPAGDDAPLLRAQVHTSLAAVALRRHDYETSARHAAAAVALTADSPLPAAAGVRGGALVGRATALYAQGAYAASADDFAAARIALESTGHIRLLAVADLNEGVLQMKRGRFADAAALLERSAAYSRRVRAPTDELMARINLLYTRLALLQQDAASEQAAAIADLTPRSADPEIRLYGDLVRVEAAEAAGRLREADALLGALSAARDSMSDILRGQAEAAAARHALALGRHDAARRLAESALALAWADEEPRDYARTWLALARAMRATDAAAADAGTEAGTDVDVAAAARAWAAGRAAPTVAVHLALIEAEAAAAGARIEQARAHYEDALREADAQGVPIDLGTVVDSYAHWLIDQGDPERAVAVLGRVQAWADGDYALGLARLRLYRALGQTALWRQALARATALAGERTVPLEWARPPASPELGIEPAAASPQ